MTIKSVKYIPSGKKGWILFRRISGDNSYSYQIISPTGKRYIADTLSKAKRIVKTKRQPSINRMDFKIWKRKKK